MNKYLVVFQHPGRPAQWRVISGMSLGDAVKSLQFLGEHGATVLAAVEAAEVVKQAARQGLTHFVVGKPLDGVRVWRLERIAVEATRNGDAWLAHKLAQEELVVPVCDIIDAAVK